MGPAAFQPSGDRIPHMESTGNGIEQWVMDGHLLLEGSAGRAGALMPLPVLSICGMRSPQRFLESRRTHKSGGS